MPQQESRVKKSLLNARVNLIFYFLTLILSFFSRKIFLDTLGADFVGLTGTLQNLLGFLNLAELGISTAIGYVLYKPLFDHDEEKITEIISVFGYLYRWIGFIILGAGLVLACFLPMIFPNTQFEMGIIFFAYFGFLTSSLIGYFANYKQTLLGADQKNYVVTAYFQTATIIKTLIQMASAYYTGSYYLWVAIELIFGIIYSFILNWKINQVYPWLRSEVRLGKQLFKKYPEVMKYTKQLFVHKIGAFSQYQLTPVLIYSFVSLQMVTYYGNYSMIIDKVKLLFENFLGGTNAGVGNLIAEGCKPKIKKVFWELISIRFFFSGIIAYSVYNLIDSFIILWLGEEYILPRSTVILMLICICINLVRNVVDQFINGYGLFYDVWSPIAECLLYLLFAIILGHLFGINGILIGNVISLVLIICIWKPYFLYSKGFKEKVSIYWINCLFYICIFFITFIITRYISYSFLIHIEMSHNFFNWLLGSFLNILIFVINYLIIMLFCFKGMRSFVRRFVKI